MSEHSDGQDEHPELVRAMLDPAFYPHRPGPVELRETHVSWVFLVGDFAYKVKKPLRFPFLDYGTLERRHRMCREEVRLNLSLAPDETRLVNVKATDPQPIDWSGLVTFSAGLFLLIFSLIRGNSEGWGSAMIVSCLVGAALLLAAFVAIELRKESSMLDMSLFRKPAFSGVSLVAFCLSAGMFSLFLYLTLYMQDVLAFSPLEAGLRFLPLTLISFFAAPLAARLSSRIPFRALMGTGLFMVGLGLVLMNGIDAGDSWTGLLPGFLLAGAGVGMTNPGIASVAIGVVEPARAGMASGINSTFRQVGVATGVAALGAIFQSRVSSELASSLPQAPGAFADAVSSGAASAALASVPAQFRDQVAAAANDAFITGLNEILLVGAAIAFVGGAASWLLVRSRDMVELGAAPAEGPADPAAAEPVPAA